MLAFWFVLTSAPLAAIDTAPLPTWVEEEVTKALTVPGAHLQILQYKPSLPATCTPQKALVPPVGESGHIALRLFGTLANGQPCHGWAWVRLQVFVKAWVTRQSVDVGAPLADMVVSAEKEVVPGRTFLQMLPEGSVAAMPLGPKVALEASHVREKTPEFGNTVTLRMRLGALTVEQEGRWVACARKMACALLPNGKRIEGRWNGQEIVVEPP